MHRCQALTAVNPNPLNFECCFVASISLSICCHEALMCWFNSTKIIPTFLTLPTKLQILCPWSGVKQNQKKCNNSTRRTAAFCYESCRTVISWYIHRMLRNLCKHNFYQSYPEFAGWTLWIVLSCWILPNSATLMWMAVSIVQNYCIQSFLVFNPHIVRKSLIRLPLYSWASLHPVSIFMQRRGDYLLFLQSSD